MNSTTKKDAIRGLLCMEALGFFILGAVIAALGVHMENTEIIKWGVGIMVGIGIIVGFFLSSLLEERREYTRHGFIQKCILN